MLKGFINILIYIFFPSLFTMLFTTDMNNKYFIIYMFLSYILLTTYFIFKYKKDLLKYLKDFNKKHIKTILIYELIGFILMILSNYIINFIIIPNGISPNDASNIELLKNNKFLYSILICIFIPFLEEIAFRLEFKHNIKNKYIFIFTSSMIFALLHIISITKLIEILYIIPYLILGLTFTLVYQKTNNIIASSLTHMLHNTLNVIFILLL